MEANLGTNSKKLIELEGVTRFFGKQVAVEELSLNVGQGEIFGLLGPNGAGKTTTIKLVTGLLRRDAGQIHLMGFDPQTQAQEVRRRVGLAPQETNMYADLSAQDNLWHHAALYNADLEGAGERIENLLRLMSLWERRRDAVRTYSGGMKRRLALARALLHDPLVIFFDEPTLGVDVQGRHALWEHIQHQREDGKTFVVSTNDMAEAEALCDRLLILDRGQTIACDTPENLKASLGRDILTLHTQPALEAPARLFEGLELSEFTHPAPDILRMEAQHGERIAAAVIQRVTAEHQLESIQVARPTLDDVFLHYTGRALRE